MLIKNLSSPYIISEIGLNHNGSIKEAYKLIEASKISNCDAVKFQIRAESFLNSDPSNMEISQQYVYQYISSTYLNFNQYEKLFEFTRNIGLDLIVSCWDLESLRFSKDSGIDTLKIASADLTNLLMIESAYEYFDNFIMSSGMSTQKEIENAVKSFIDNKKELCLMHCQSAYPAPVDSLNLNYILRLRNLYPNLLIGYSGHELEYNICIAALALGAIVFEKHITLDKSKIGNDHKISLYPDEMKDLCEKLRYSYQSLGSSHDREIQPGEKMNRISLAKSLSLNKKLSIGEVIKKSEIDFVSGGRGIKPDQYKLLIGKTLIKDKSPGEFIELSDIKELKEDIEFDIKPIPNCNLGIPVRYHDAVQLYKEIKPLFLEFHLSYKDIDYPLERIKSLMKEIPYNLNHTFHSPDFYANDLIFDPFSEDKYISEKSKGEFERFLNHVNDLKTLFKSDKNYKIPVITSFSCATLTTFLDEEKVDSLYLQLSEYINYINQKFDNLIVLPQTLPVNAWYLGGRRLVNLFADPRRIYNFCNTYNIEICLDTAHTIMSSNFYNLNSNEWITKLLDFSYHVHLVDAKGDSDEGLSFGKGDLNLIQITQRMSKNKNLSYVPEIWQGHHNMGEGFKKAIKALTLLNLT